MLSLCLRLQPSEEVKIVTNRPAVEIEEVTPAAASDATLLAPEEVMPTTRGEVKASTEKTTTDRKRERRAKKSAQHLRAAKKQKKFRSGKNKTEAAVEQIKKQAKSGKVVYSISPVSLLRIITLF